MALADSLRKVANKAITKFGGDVTIRFVTAGVYNTTTGQVAETESDTVTKGVVENVSDREVDELIKTNDKRLTVAASSLDSAPGTKDRVVIDSVVYQIIQVNTTEQDNKAITYELILRA